MKDKINLLEIPLEKWSYDTTLLAPYMPYYKTQIDTDIVTVSYYALAKEKPYTIYVNGEDMEDFDNAVKLYKHLEEQRTKEEDNKKQSLKDNYKKRFTWK